MSNTIEELEQDARSPQEHQMGEIDIGEVEWHCSEEDSGPDVGLLLRLDASQYLWAGEITREDWEAAGDDAKELGEDAGWWAIFYEENGGRKTVLGRFVDKHTAQEFIEKLAWIIKQADQALSKGRP